MAEDRWDAGLEMRRQVLGDEYVDRALQAIGTVAEPLQRLVTEYCWGTVWSRGTLSRKERSLVTLSMLIAQDHPNEIELHTRGALRNGNTPEEVVEVVLQAAIYCGVPAAINAMKAVTRALEAAAAEQR